MAAPFVNGGYQSGAPPLTITYTSVAGNLLVVGCYSFSATATFAISDSASQVWNAGSVVTNGSVRIQFFYMPNSAQITWVTCTITNSSGTPSFALAEFSGYGNFDTGDTETNTGTSGTISSGGFSITNGDLVVGWAFGTTLVVGAGYIMPAACSGANTGIEYQVGSGTSATVGYTCASGAWAVEGYAFKAVSGGITISVADILSLAEALD